MVVTILGCGTSTGVPIINCQCAVCTSDHPRNKRLRASAWIQVDGKHLLIDTSPDLRQQALRERVPRVDAVLFTHPHADHIHGIDELRSFNFTQKASIPVFGNQWTADELLVKFSYIFKPAARIEGGGIPQLTLKLIDAYSPEIDILGTKVIPLPLSHGSKECVGYRLDRIAYITDCSYIPELTIERIQGVSVLILDCLRIAPHGTHFNLDQALETIAKVKPKETYLTHLGHDFDYPEWSQKLPKGVALAYDGLKINIERLSDSL